MPGLTSPTKHVFTDTEWQACEALGFVIYAPGATLSLVDFINTHFSGLEVLQYLSEVDTLLKDMTAKPLTKLVSFCESDPQELVVQYYSNDHDDDQNGLALSRTFVKDTKGKTAIHDFFRIPRASRKQGHGKAMLKIGLQHYLKMGVDLIKVNASLEDGGYVWAKAHFTGVSKSEMSIILAKAQLTLSNQEFTKVKEVFDNYYNTEPNGTAFPIHKWSNMPEMVPVLRNSDWNGEINLNNSELLANFRNYVTG